MEKNLYIDASHPNETRVVLKSGENIEDYEYEGLKNNLIKNNIYLGKVSRIEPSLQAAFVDFGRERHGFLSFNDIQSDYYQIPKADLERIKEEEEKAREELSREVEAKEEENIAEGKLEIDDPLEKIPEEQTEEDSNNKENISEKENLVDGKEKKNFESERANAVPGPAYRPPPHVLLALLVFVFFLFARRTAATHGLTFHVSGSLTLTNKGAHGQGKTLG